MEEKYYKWFFNFIQGKEMPCSIVETVILSKQKPVVWHKDQYVQNQRRQDLKSHQDSLSVFNHFHSKWQENGRITDRSAGKICYVTTKENRRILDSQNFSNFIQNQGKVNQVLMIQEYIPQSIQHTYFIVLQYYKKIYHSKYYYKDTSGAVQEAQQDMLYTLILDYCKQIMSQIEHDLRLRVIEIKLEFLYDLKGQVKLLNCERCLLMDPLLIRKHIIDNQEDIYEILRTSKRKQKEKRYQKSKRQEIRASQMPYKIMKTNQITDWKRKYVFINGQIRNKDSPYCTPIRISTPNIVEYEPEPRKPLYWDFPKSFNGVELNQQDGKQQLKFTRSFQDLGTFSGKNEVTSMAVDYMDNAKLLYIKRIKDERFWSKLQGLSYTQRIMPPIKINEESKDFQEIIKKTLDKININPLSPKVQRIKKEISLDTQKVCKEQPILVQATRQEFIPPKQIQVKTRSSKRIKKHCSQQSSPMNQLLESYNERFKLLKEKYEGVSITQTPKVKVVRNVKSPYYSMQRLRIKRYT